MREQKGVDRDHSVGRPVRNRQESTVGEHPVGRPGRCVADHLGGHIHRENGIEPIGNQRRIATDARTHLDCHVIVNGVATKSTLKSVKNHRGALGGASGMPFRCKGVEHLNHFGSGFPIPANRVQSGNTTRHDPHRVLLVAYPRRHMPFDLDRWENFDEAGHNSQYRPLAADHELAELRKRALELHGVTTDEADKVAVIQENLLLLCSLILRDHKGLDRSLIVEDLRPPQARVGFQQVSDEVHQIDIGVGPRRDHDVKDLPVVCRDSDGNLIIRHRFATKDRRRGDHTFGRCRCGGLTRRLGSPSDQRGGSRELRFPAIASGNHHSKGNEKEDQSSGRHNTPNVTGAGASSRVSAADG